MSLELLLLRDAQTMMMTIIIFLFINKLFHEPKAAQMITTRHKSCARRSCVSTSLKMNRKRAYENISRESPSQSESMINRILHIATATM